MKWKFIGLAIVITILMLVIARANSRGRSERVTRTVGQITCDLTTVPKIEEHKRDTVRVKIDGLGPRDNVLFRNVIRDAAGRDTVVSSQVLQAKGTGEFAVELTAGTKGGKRLYVFDVVDSTGQHVARFFNENGEPFSTRFIGAVPSSVLGLHIAFIFATVFFVAMGALYSWQLVKGADTVKQIAFHFFWATICCLLGGYPFGFAMNYYAFGGLWEGVPFGTDATDNKTQLIFIYLLFAAVVAAGHYGRGMLGRPVFSQTALGRIGMGSVLVMAFIYLIPHSIQFSAGLTYSFCYAFTAAVVLAYLIGFFTSKPAVALADDRPARSKAGHRK